jgi:hypothetical protein
MLSFPFGFKKMPIFSHLEWLLHPCFGWPVCLPVLSSSLFASDVPLVLALALAMVFIASPKMEVGAATRSSAASAPPLTRQANAPKPAAAAAVAASKPAISAQQEQLVKKAIRRAFEIGLRQGEQREKLEELVKKQRKEQAEEDQFLAHESPVAVHDCGIYGNDCNERGRGPDHDKGSFMARSNPSNIMARMQVNTRTRYIAPPPLHFIAMFRRIHVCARASSRRRRLLP